MSFFLRPTAAAEPAPFGWRGGERLSRAWAWLLLFALVAVAGTIFLLKCPPLWRDYDGLIQISNKPNDMTLLQYPPAYPAFSRLHLYAANWLVPPVGKARVVPKVHKSVPLNDAGLHALLFTQQLALALACTFFVWVVGRSWGGGIVAALVLLSNATIFLAGHLISTEALSQSLIVAFIALGLQAFVRREISWVQYTVYALLIFLLVLTRHANSVFAGIAPLALLARCALVRWSEGAWDRRAWWQAVALTVLGILGIQAADWTARGLCRVFDVPYRETGMRGPSEKLGFVELMPDEERARFLAELQAKATDPVVREAIPKLARVTSWDKQRSEIEAILLRAEPRIDPERLKARADGYLGQVVAAYYRSASPYLVRDTASSISRALAATPTNIANYYFDVTEHSFRLFTTELWMTKLTQGLQTTSPAALKKIQNFRQSSWFRIWSWLSHGVVLGLAAGAALVLLWRRVGDPARHLFALSIVCIGLLATVLTFVFVHFELRFASAANLLGFLALALVLGNTLDHFFARAR